MRIIKRRLNLASSWKNILVKRKICADKSLELCLREGDKNSKYFYSCTINRRRINIIYRIKNKDGKWICSGEEMGFKLCYHIKSILSMKGPRELSLLKEVINPIVSG